MFTYGFYLLRRISRASLILFVFIVFVTVAPASGQPADPGDISIVFADFEGPDPEGIPVTETLFSWLQQLADEENFYQIDRLNETILYTTENNREIALEKGLEAGVDLIVWGYYDLPSVRARIGFSAVCCSGTQAGSVLEFDFFREEGFLLSELAPESEPPDRMRFVADILTGFCCLSSEDYQSGLQKLDEAMVYRGSVSDQMFAMAYSLRALLKLSGPADLDGAAADAGMAIQLDPENADYHMHRGYTYYLQGNYQAALQDYIAASNIEPENPGILSDLSSIYLETGDYDNAMEAISNAILLSPDSYRYLNSRGSICNHEEKYEAAIEDISRALELNPSYPTGWANLACSQRELGQLDQAVQSFSKAIDYQTDPALISSYLCDRASCNLLMNNDESAINDYLEGLNLYPGSPANYADLGWLLIEAERYGEAVSAYSAALELAGDNANYLCERAFASYHLGDNSPVIEDLAAAYSIDQDVFTSDRYDLLGRVYAEEDQMAMAAESFSMALELETDPLNRAWLLSSRGKCYYYLGDYQSSLMDQAAAVELNPSEPFFHFKYAEDCYMLNLDEEAVTHFTKAIELGLPMEYTSECLFQRGRIYLDNEIFEEAIQDFTILMEADSSYPDAFFFRGIAFFYIDETELCRSDMARYLELGSNPGYREDAAGIMELTE